MRWADFRIWRELMVVVCADACVCSIAEDRAYLHRLLHRGGRQRHYDGGAAVAGPTLCVRG